MLVREDLLTIAKRNVERGRELVDSQRVVVCNLKTAGLETKPNEDVLNMFERQLAKFEDDHARLLSRSGPYPLKFKDRPWALGIGNDVVSGPTRSAGSRGRTE